MDIRNSYGNYADLLGTARRQGSSNIQLTRGMGRIKELQELIERNVQKTEARTKMIGTIAGFAQGMETNMRRYGYMKSGAEMLGQPITERKGVLGIFDKIGTALTGPKVGPDSKFTQAGLEMLGAAKISAPSFVPEIQKIVQQYYGTGIK
jgi:hypothetical protein